ELHALDVGARVGHGFGDVGVETSTIGRLEGQPNEEELAIHFLPIDVQTSLGLVRQEQDVGAVGAVDAYSAAARHVADHRITGYGLAALGVAHHEAVHALDAHALRR